MSEPKWIGGKTMLDKTKRDYYRRRARKEKKT